ncbi:MAG: hypothetical protein AAF446_09410 [Pseudomonadota bacterium]
MAFHEKSAWIMTLALLIGGLFYFGLVVLISNEMQQLAPPLLPLIVIYTIIQIILAVVGHILIAIWTPKEANASLDERDRRINERAGHWSGYVIGIGVITSLGLYLFTRNGDLLFYAVFASLMLSALAEYASQIVLYRTRL